MGFLSKSLIAVVFPLLICGIYAFSLKKPGLFALFLCNRSAAFGVMQNIF
jgi:hypothetical protein